MSKKCLSSPPCVGELMYTGLALQSLLALCSWCCIPFFGGRAQHRRSPSMSTCWHPCLLSSLRPGEAQCAEVSCRTAEIDPLRSSVHKACVRPRRVSYLVVRSYFCLCHGGRGTRASDVVAYSLFYWGISALLLASYCLLRYSQVRTAVVAVRQGLFPSDGREYASLVEVDAAASGGRWYLLGALACLPVGAAFVVQLPEVRRECRSPFLVLVSSHGGLGPGPV